jgi:5'-3' exonuclease
VYAKKLVQSYGTVENIIQAARDAKITPRRLGHLVLEGAQAAILSKQLVSLNEALDMNEILKGEAWQDALKLSA